ncbi:CHAT domain-containing protein [Streptomyces canus]|uniref:CHAT domain-containing protein n=1 Tax=Streptomyces canus TaxID=58343 RepID=UPI0022539302|nr:CHAT domain-containing protein [Streptomyces canus]MCX4858285.1 CHAT domain-containing protein [Streptomyces canus]
MTESDTQEARDFTLRSWDRPWTELQSLLAEDRAASSPWVRARLASLHGVLGNAPEQFAYAADVLARPTATLDMLTRIRAHASCASAAALTTPDNRLLHGVDSLGHARAALHLCDATEFKESPVVLSAFLSCAAAFAFAHDAAGSQACLARLPPAIAKWPQGDSLRIKIELMGSLNAVFLSGADARTLVAALMELHQRAAALEVPQVCALIDEHLAELFRTNGLYTPAIIHGERARSAWERLARPEKVAAIELLLMKVYLGLGATGEVERLRDRLVALRRTESGFRIVRAEVLSGLADLAFDAGDIARSEQDYDAAHLLLEPEVAAGHRGFAIGTRAGIITGGIRAAVSLSRGGRRPEWRERQARLGLDVDHYVASTNGFGKNLMALMDAVLSDDPVAAEPLSRSLAHKALATNPYGRMLVGNLTDLVKLAGASKPGTNLKEDLDEYWQHLEHFAGEDSEDIRLAYRGANIVPVLNRILASNPALTAWTQFEAVELARWGSVAGAQAIGVPGDTEKSHARRLALSAYQSQGIVFPASVGQARGISCTLLGGSSFPAPARDIGEAVGAAGWAQPPDILQLYLRGRAVHWCLLELEGPRIASGTFPATSAARTLAWLNDWASPRPTRLDAQSAAATGASEAQLTVLAAMRCAAGPFVAQPELAADFSLALPRKVARAALARVLALEEPSTADICAGIGELLPGLPELYRRSRPLLISAQNGLATVPFTMARPRAGGRLLGTARPVLTLAPMNTLTHMRTRPRAGPETVDWKLTVIGNCVGDLGYCGDTSSPADLNAALMLTAAEADSAAVLYKGHFVRGANDWPSQGGLATGPGGDRLLRASDVLLDRTDRFGPLRLAIMACEASGWGLSPEWGGTASALMLRGVREVIAPHWPIIDSPSSALIDTRVQSLLTHRGDLPKAYGTMIADLADDWLHRPAHAVAPHWWAGLTLVKG